MRVVKILAGLVIGLLLVVLAAAGLARFLDGPLGMLPGGALVSGERVEAPVADWSFAAEIETIEMQLVADDTSRTTWIVVHDGRAYIPCSLGFPPGKKWYRRADRDGDARVRIDGRLYPVRLSRVHDEKLASELKEAARAKYGGGPPSGSEVWFFAIESRPS